MDSSKEKDGAPHSPSTSGGGSTGTSPNASNSGGNSASASSGSSPNAPGGKTGNASGTSPNTPSSGSPQGTSPNSSSASNSASTPNAPSAKSSDGIVNGVVNANGTSSAEQATQLCTPANPNGVSGDLGPQIKAASSSDSVERGASTEYNELERIASGPVRVAAELALTQAARAWGVAAGIVLKIYDSAQPANQGSDKQNRY
jgi:hypothetical protein